MKQVETFLFRPNLADRAQYYAVTFLNQLELSHKPREGGSALAKTLIGIYFRLFALILAGKMGAAAAAEGQVRAGARGWGCWEGGGRRHEGLRGRQGTGGGEREGRAAEVGCLWFGPSRQQYGWTGVVDAKAPSASLGGLLVVCVWGGGIFIVMGTGTCHQLHP
jgi:hypothetical protein